MNPQLLPAQLRDDVPAWAQTVQAFLAEKERRSGTRRTVEGYSRMLWPFLDRFGSPDRVTPAHCSLPRSWPWPRSSHQGRASHRHVSGARRRVTGLGRLERPRQRFGGARQRS